jgi:hypothetical protein
MCTIPRPTVCQSVKPRMPSLQARPPTASSRMRQDRRHSITGAPPCTLWTRIPQQLAANQQSLASQVHGLMGAGLSSGTSRLLTTVQPSLRPRGLRNMHTTMLCSSRPTTPRQPLPVTQEATPKTTLAGAPTLL